MPEPDYAAMYEPPGAPGEPAGPRPADLGLWLRWEKLRVLYNLILAAVVLLVWAAFFRTRLPFRVLLVESVVGAIGANICFCIGPVANAYACWLGWRHVAVTWVLFVAGTGLSVLGAAVAVAESAGLFLHSPVLNAL